MTSITVERKDSSEAYIESLRGHIASGNRVIVTRTREPYRAIESIKYAAQAANTLFKHWDVLRGWVEYKIIDPQTGEEVEKNDGMSHPFAAIQAIHATVPDKANKQLNPAGYEKPFNAGIYVMLNYHFFMDGGQLKPQILQAIKQYSQEFPSCADGAKALVLVVPEDFKCPIEIEDDVAFIDFELPSMDERFETILSVLADFDESLADEESLGELGNREFWGRVLNASSGLTAKSFADHLTDAILKLGYDSDLYEIDPEAVAEMVNSAKTEVVNRSDILEVMRPEDMSNVGGQDLLKKWILNRKSAFSPEAKDFGIEPPRGVLLVGVPGCVAEGTVIQYQRGKRNSGRWIRIEELYKKFNGIPTSSNGWEDLFIETKTHSYSPDTDAVFYNTIKGVVEQGEKECITVTTDGAGEVTLTSDHLVLTEKGYVAAGDLSIGDTLIVKGNMMPQSSGGRKKPPYNRVVVEALKYYNSGWKNNVTEPTSGKTYEYRRQHRSRLVVEAHMNKVSYEEYVHALKNDPEHTYRKVIGKEYDVHHLDDNPENDELSNLQVMLRSEHLQTHREQHIKNFNVNYTDRAKVTGISPAGKRMTYDITMDETCPSFVVNDGIIVHNCGKSVAAKAIAGTLGVPLIRFDVARVFNALVGSSESRIRSALKLVDALEPAVLWIDEIDKVFDTRSGGGDSGVSTRVLGTLLTWMQETKSQIFVVMTANRTQGLPPEMLRKGRLDEIFCVGAPSYEELKQIINIHVSKRGHDPSKLDVDLIASKADGYVPSEVECAVKEALLRAFNEGTELDTDVIIEELENMVPLSESHAEDFQRMEKWAEKNARPSSSSPRSAQKEEVSTRSVPRRRKVGTNTGGSIDISG